MGSASARKRCDGCRLLAIGDFPPVMRGSGFGWRGIVLSVSGRGPVDVGILRPFC